MHRVIYVERKPTDNRETLYKEFETESEAYYQAGVIAATKDKNKMTKYRVIRIETIGGKR